MLDSLSLCKPLDYTILERIIRVNQAGEYGAVCIYAGQIAVLRNKPYSEIIKIMLDGERAHLNICNKILTQYHVRPTILQPFWYIMGFSLGVGTAILGNTSAMACTVSVEEVITRHYNQQLKVLKTVDPELQRIVLKLRGDEITHCVSAYSRLRECVPPLLDLVVKTGTKLAIWLSERV